jgi:transketolase
MGNTGDKSAGYEKRLLELCNFNENFIVLTAENRALIRNTEDALGERFIDTGINEQTIVGFSAGLALQGYKPIVHALAAFLTMRAFEFVRTDVGLPNLPVKLMSFIPGILSDGNGQTHQAIEDISIMRGIPNMEIYTPSCEQDLVLCLPHILTNDAPCYVRLNHLPGVTEHQNYSDQTDLEVLFDGHKTLVISYGIISQNAFIAVKEFNVSKNDKIGLLSVRKIWPLNIDLFCSIIEKYSNIIVIEDHFSLGGLRTIIAELNLSQYLNKNFHFINLGNTPFKAGNLKAVAKNTKMDSDGIKNQLSKLTKPH